MRPDEENAVWDPEKADRQAKIRNLRLLAVILLIVAAGGICLRLVTEHKKRTGEVALSASMTYAEADQTLRESGFIPMGLTYRSGSRALQTYDSRVVFGCMPVYSTLEGETLNGEKRLRLSHIFEEYGDHDAENPGETYEKLLKELTKLYGAPEELNDIGWDYCRWTRKDGSRVLLGYMAESVPLLCYDWTDNTLYEHT